MKIYVFCDLEGCSGVANNLFVNDRFQDIGGKFMAADINACIAGCLDAGAEEVIVRDGHSSGTNFTLADLEGEHFQLVQGATPGIRFAGAEGCAGIILLGYHAMAGTAGACLEHTYNSQAIQNEWLNGKKVGEIGMDAAIAAEYGMPVLLVTGDDKACAEAREWIPGVHTCQVKTSYSTQGTRMLPLPVAHKKIREAAARAVRERVGAEPLQIERPATVRIEWMERVPTRPDIRYKTIDGRTQERTSNSVEEIYLR
ncbi:MAG: M55 family metallopeptidase [Victivallales bacterium]|nr:M55 family metallopeptidase [Victivallales bacterium]